MITSQITIGLGMRPCAPCGAYVPAYRCAHWRKPAATPTAERSRALRARHKAAAEAARKARG